MLSKLKIILVSSLMSLGLLTSSPSPANNEPNELSALPELGDPSQQALPLQQEKEMGKALVAYLQHNGLLVQDPDLRSYLDSLTNQLIGWVKMPYPLFFYIINDPSINAFAAPGGIIVLHTGLILASQTESELASVVAHEMAHISQRHAARNYAQAQKLSLPTAAAMLAAILIGSQSPAAAQAAIIGVQAGSIQNQLNYSRSHEREADSIGMQILHQANIDATGMSDFFLRLQQQSRYSGNKIPPFLSTHPVTDERIANAQDRNRHQKGQGRRDSLGFHLARIKLLTTYTTSPQQTLLQLSEQDSDNPLVKDAARYGQALILQKTGRYSQARSLLSSLVKKYPDEIQFILALARVENDANNPQQAIAYYQAAYDTFFNNPVLLLDYSRGATRDY